MKLTNKSARLLTLNLAGAYVQVAPLATVELTEAQAADAQALLGGVLKPLIDTGDLVLDVAPASAPSSEPPSSSAAEAPSPSVTTSRSRSR